ncbi:putative box C/D snoRNA protein SPCC613.07 [Lolium rigidum]|uniref:putative box C/D snoRNA protein SPCC613.07 n=1 Tax=Lolium rigidum TaxID=89674 RepID=UPI001F5CDDD3|nr:putative box C/D snoRNA protein SPCC613.07 [Lolium rigidum]
MEPEPPAQDPPPSAASSSGTGGGGGEKGGPCEECGEQPWKYRCPGCSRLTCSLPCVQAHKRRTACSGKRPRTAPVPLAQFDDNQLLSDYNLLEETNQVREAAHRLVVGYGRNYGGGDGATLPSWLFFLRKAAHRRGVRLFFLPRGMARREQNRSRHFHRKDIIYWTLEWRFNSIDIILTDHQIDEHASLLSLLEKHLSPTPLKDQLTPYRNTELRDLKLFIQKSAKDSKSPYRQLNIEEPLHTQLRGILIVEYPTINVFLPSDTCEFEVEKFVNKIRNEQPPGSSNDSPPIEGTEFQEEEIEEGEMVPETQVIDLKDRGPSRTTNLTSLADTSGSKVDSNKGDSSVLSYIRSLGLDGLRGKLNQHSKIEPKTPSWTTEPKSCMKVYPLDSEESVDGWSLESQAIDLEEHATSHPFNRSPAKLTTIPNTECKMDSSVLCPISILASDGFSRPQEEYYEQNKLAPNTTPEALKRRSRVKVYPLDMDTEDAQGLFSEAPNQEFELDAQNAYEEDLFGDMDPDDFLNFDLEIMDEGSFEIRSPFKLWDDLEEGEIPSQL